MSPCLPATLHPKLLLTLRPNGSNQNQTFLKSPLGCWSPRGGFFFLRHPGAGHHERQNKATVRCCGDLSYLDEPSVKSGTDPSFRRLESLGVQPYVSHGSCSDPLVL